MIKRALEEWRRQQQQAGGATTVAASPAPSSSACVNRWFDACLVVMLSHDLTLVCTRST